MSGTVPRSGGGRPGARASAGSSARGTDGGSATTKSATTRSATTRSATARSARGPVKAKRRSAGGYVLAVANQKGGVAKTTSVASLGAAFAEAGKRVLLVDLDPQACLTFSLGVDPDDVQLSINEVLLGKADVGDAIIEAGEGVHLIPSVIDLAGVEAQLLTRPGREFLLRGILEPILADYDVVLLDCSPSLGVLTLAALTAADGLIIPMPCEMLSHRGVGQLLDTVRDVTALLNPSLEVVGVLPTLFDGRSTHAQAVLADVGERYGLPVLHPPIPKTIRFAEAPAVGRSILSTARRSKGAAAYRQVAAGLTARINGA